MDTPEKRRQLEALAEEIFNLSKIGTLARAQARKDGSVETLTETENLTLSLLIQNEVMTVGEIQKAIGVLPAQMSRIIRALEDKGGTAYLACSINPDDRRRIDVTITDDGREAYNAYRSARLDSAMRVLAVLEVSEREEFMRLLRKIRDHMSKYIIKK